MKFKNATKEKVRVRIDLNNGMTDWKTVKSGDSIEMDGKYAKRLGLVPVKKGEEPKAEEKPEAEGSELGGKKVETKKVKE